MTCISDRMTCDSWGGQFLPSLTRYRQPRNFDAVLPARSRTCDRQTPQAGCTRSPHQSAKDSHLIALVRGENQRSMCADGVSLKTARRTAGQRTPPGHPYLCGFKRKAQRDKGEGRSGEAHFGFFPGRCSQNVWNRQMVRISKFCTELTTWYCAPVPHKACHDQSTPSWHSAGHP